MMVNIVKIKDKSRTIPISITVLETPFWITGLLRLNSVTCDSELVDLLTYQNLQLRERNIDLKH
jgi:hypothetical protein